VTEYLERIIRPRMATIEGVAEAQILGAQNFAMRVWIDPVRLAARDITASDVLQAINASNFLSAPGKTENEYVARSITMQTTLQTPEAFGALPLKTDGDEVVRLRDVATVELGRRVATTPS
jgi:multidrug efflux pump